MSTLVTYKSVDGGDIQEVSPDPAPAAGYSLNTNFRAIADSLPRNNYGASTDPTPDNDAVDTAGIGVDFSKGSRWYNGTAIFECVDPTPTAAVWAAVIANVGGTVNFLGATLNANNGSGTGGGILDMDGGAINFGSGGSIVDDGAAGAIISGQLTLYTENLLNLSGGKLERDRSNFFVSRFRILAIRWLPPTRAVYTGKMPVPRGKAIAWDRRVPAPLLFLTRLRRSCHETAPNFAPQSQQFNLPVAARGESTRPLLASSGRVLRCRDLLIAGCRDCCVLTPRSRPDAAAHRFAKR